MLKIGVTGGIGSGKSTVCRIFEQLGIPVYNSDDRAKWLVQHHSKLIAEVKTVFGDEAYLPDGTYNKKYIAGIVFNQPEKLEILNAIIHPAVFEDFREWVSEQKNCPYVIKEAALIFESGSFKELDAVINVNAPVRLRMARVKNRDGITQKEIKSRMNKQWDDNQRTLFANFVILNNEKESLIKQVLNLHHTFVQMAAEQTAT